MRVVLAVLFVASFASAQTGEVVGTVTEAGTGEPLVGVAVRLDGTRLGGATDIEGRFVIADVPVGTYAATASYIGYQTVAQEIVVDEGQSSLLQFDLEVSYDMISCYIVCYSTAMVPRGAFTSRVLTTGAESWCSPSMDGMVYRRDAGFR